MICLLKTQIIVYPEKKGTLSMEDGYETIPISHTTRLEVLTWNKQTTKYFSSKHRLIWNQQRTAIWGLQPWQPCVGPLITREENSFPEGKGGWEGLVNKEFSASHWQSPCQEKKRGVCFFSCALLQSEGVRAPPSGFLFNWGFCLLIFNMC